MRCRGSLAYYFAYASDVRSGALAEILGRDPPRARRARLIGYRLGFTAFSQDWEGGVADIVREPGAGVEGVAFPLGAADVLRLDLYEGLDEGLYRRRHVRVELEDGREVSAFTYEVATKRAFVQPSAAYLDALVSGATEQGLSEGYIRGLLELYPDEAVERRSSWADDEE